jgi:hypothetical protein
LTDHNAQYATQDAVIEALSALTPDECRQLDYQARRLAFGTIYATGQALFSEAIERALDLRRKWCPAEKPFTVFLRNTMGSIASNDRKGFHAQRISNVSALASGEDDVDDDAFLSTRGDELPKNSVMDVLEEAEEHAAILRDYDSLFAHFARDDAVCAILVATELELVGSEIKDYCELDDAEYLAARKRLNRGVAKLKSQRTEQ